MGVLILLFVGDKNSFDYEKFTVVLPKEMDQEVNYCMLVRGQILHLKLGSLMHGVKNHPCLQVYPA